MITVYSNLTDVKTPKYYEIDKVFDSIKLGGEAGTLKNRVEMIRLAPDKDARNKLKKDLPVISFSGKFRKRGDAYCLEHSGFVCLDFDHLPDLELYRKRLRNDKYTYALFTSPSGDGLKCIVKIPPSIDEHRYYCKSLFNYYNSPHLDKLFDISRLCFASYDPDIYINPDSEVYTDKEIDGKPAGNTVSNPINNPHKVYDYILKWLNKKNEYIDGNKHNFLVKLVSACNRFGIDPEFVKNKIIFDFQNKADYVSDRDFITLVNNVYRIYQNNFKTQFFESDTEPDERIYEADIPLTDIFQIQDLKEQMISRFENGEAMGETTYFPNIDTFFKWKRGQFNVFTGIGNYGKTTFLNQLVLMKTIKEGTRWGVYSPEQYPAYDYFDDMIHTLVGNNVMKQYEQTTGRMSKKQYEKAAEFLNDKIYFIYPEEENPTPDYILSKFKYLILKNKIDGIIIDPYNQLDHSYNNGIREDMYISQFILKVKRFIQMNNVYFALIIHPKVINKDAKGNYPCPDVFDLAGGAMWNNKSDNIYVVHKENKETEFMSIKSLKIKRKHMTGNHGETMMEFNFPSNRLLYMGESPLNCIENPFYTEQTFKNELPYDPFPF